MTIFSSFVSTPFVNSLSYVPNWKLPAVWRLDHRIDPQIAVSFASAIASEALIFMGLGPAEFSLVLIWLAIERVSVYVLRYILIHQR